MVYLIDNGHGMETPGKRSPIFSGQKQILEYEYARRLALEVIKGLRANDIDCDFLVRETSDISLTERCRRVNEIVKQHGRKNVLVVSIHLNAAKNNTATGWEIHTYSGQSISDVYASIFHKNAKNILGVDAKMRGDWSDGDPDFDSNFAILRDTLCPSVLTENMFMTNEKDVKKLNTPAFFDKLVKLHVDSILEIDKLI